jgi:hypothetical protein
MFKVGDILVPSEYVLNIEPERMGAKVEVIIAPNSLQPSFKAVVLDGGMVGWDVGKEMGFMSKYWQLASNYYEKTYEDCL